MDRKQQFNPDPLAIDNARDNHIYEQWFDPHIPLNSIAASVGFTLVDLHTWANQPIIQRIFHYLEELQTLRARCIASRRRAAVLSALADATCTNDFELSRRAATTFLDKETSHPQPTVPRLTGSPVSRAKRPVPTALPTQHRQSLPQR